MSEAGAGDGSRILAASRAVLLLVALAGIAGVLLRPVGDPDFFWHLRTGEWISEHRALPDRFLFVSSPPNSPEVVQRFTMTSYWLAQLLIHLFHAAGGLAGVAVLRALLWLALLLAMFLARDGDDLVFLGLLPLTAVILANFPAERPQFLSFVFSGVLLLLLRGIRGAATPAGARRRAAAIPPLLLVWANCHGGYLVGLGILAVWLIAESLKRLHPRLGQLPRERFLPLLAAAAAACALSFVNPNTWHVFEVALLPSWHTRSVQEYRSTVEIYRYYGDAWVLAYWALLGLATAALALARPRPDLTDIALAVALGYASFARIRFIPFFVVFAVPLVCRRLSAPGLARWSRIAAATAGLALGLRTVAWAAPMYRHPAAAAGADEYQLPVEAAEFILSEKPAGNMYNHYTWGGYLLWRLAPAEVFIDGRNSDQDLYEAGLLVLKGGRAPVHGLPFWKQYFLTRGIRYTVTTHFDSLSGEVHRLFDNLLADPAWVPVFVNANAAIFVEDVPENRALIARNALPRELFFPALLESLGDVIDAFPGYAQARVARGEVLLRLGQGAAALEEFQRVLWITPRQPVALAHVAELERRLGRAAPPDR